MNRKMPGWLAAVVACVCAALVLGLVDRFSGATVEALQAKQTDSVRSSVIEGAGSFELQPVEESRYSLDNLYAAKDPNGEVLGYVGQTTVTGYGGPVEVTAGVDLQGAVTGIAVGGEDFSETPGLGALTRETAFTDQFVGKTPVITLNEDGVDTVSGASTTSRAVVSGVNSVARYVRTYALGMDKEETEVYMGATASATRKGFGGDVTATVGLSDDGEVAYLSIDTPDETDGLGKMASEDSFTGQFIGKKGPFTYGQDGIEAITGATFTSEAALEAINEIITGGGAASAEPVSASAQGFGGEVTVTARLNADNTIAALTIETPNETDGLGKMASESAFTDQFIGKAAPFAYGEEGIEAVSGATVTSTAVLEALNSIVPEGNKASAADEAEKTLVEENAAPEASEADDNTPEVEAETQDGVSEIVVESEERETAPVNAEEHEENLQAYTRPRPVMGSTEQTPVPAMNESLSAYTRPRPVLSNAVSDASDANGSGNISAYARPRPAPADAEETPALAENGALSAYTRPRPVSTSALSDAPRMEESGDLSAYARPRPGTAETASEDPAADDAGLQAYTRPRPSAGVPASDVDAGDTNGSLSDYVRPRPVL